MKTAKLESFQNRSEIFSSLLPEWPVDLLPEIQHHIAASSTKVVVLDDDPTGTQTVHDLPVLTDWSTESLISELNSSKPAVYLLTNSRSLPDSEAQAMYIQIGKRLVQASKESGHNFVLVSRSDSTLRGHFPSDLQALEQSLEKEFDAWLIIPFFLEGGRYTINDIHYVTDGEQLIPAGKTEFAKDAAFGYRSSNLRDWVSEKTGNLVSADQVASITLQDLRQGGPGRVRELLMGLRSGQVCIVNAASYRDLEVFVLGLLKVEAQGRRFVYRTAASFVRVRAGVLPRPLLKKEELKLPERGGCLFITGSYVPKTTRQLEHLKHHWIGEWLEVDVTALLDDNLQLEEIRRVVQAVNLALGSDRDVMVTTSRKLITASDIEANLSIGQRVSESLVAIVQRLTTRPRYILAKGGITSSDVATVGLKVQKAVVLGQILSGVPVWQIGNESLFPGLPYIVFPGNVGDDDALLEIARKLDRHEVE